MNSLKYTLVFSLIFLFMLKANAQTPVKGCLVGATVHTSPDDLGLVNAAIAAIFGGIAAYKNSPNEPQISACINYSQTNWVNPAAACRVCPNGYSVLNLVTGCNGTAYDGNIVTKTIVSCDLDDYAHILVISLGVFGLSIISRRLSPLKA